MKQRVRLVVVYAALVIGANDRDQAVIQESLIAAPISTPRPCGP